MTDDAQKRPAEPHASQAEEVADKHRRLQQEQDAKEDGGQAKKGGSKNEGSKNEGSKSGGSKDEGSKGKGGDKHQAPPTDPRHHPTQFAEQHQSKPGSEADLDPAPQFLARGYEGSNKLRGRVALITGGDSGIGRAVAVLFAREGAQVAIVYLEEHEDAEETCRCVEAEGGQCLLLAGDVGDTAFCEEAVRRTVDEFGQLDVLVNNAAFQEHAASLEDISDEQLEETLRTNVHGYLRMTRAALPHLKAGASIINTGSVVGLIGSAELLDYSLTKGAIHTFTKSLARNLLKRGIRVNAVAPGPVWTPLNPADRPADEVARFGQNSDMRRAAQPEELSPAYVFLASPICSGYVSGIVLPVTGSVGAI
ncbi:MAG: SDR family oxidoreductase [Burkholderiaceae bacterium]